MSVASPEAVGAAINGGLEAGPPGDKLQRATLGGLEVALESGCDRLKAGLAAANLDSQNKQTFCKALQLDGTLASCVPEYFPGDSYKPELCT